MNSRDYKKNKNNAMALSKLHVGNRVKVVKTNETGVITKIIAYNRDKVNSPYGYSTVQVRFDDYNRLPHYKKVRHFSASSPVKIN